MWRSVGRHGCCALLFRIPIAATRRAAFGAVREGSGCLRGTDPLNFRLFLVQDNRKIVAIAKGTRRLLFLLWSHLQVTFGTHASVATGRPIDLGVVQEANGAFFRGAAAFVGAFKSFLPRGDAAVGDKSSNCIFLPITTSVQPAWLATLVEFVSAQSQRTTRKRSQTVNVNL